jgi:hypothetical protein
MILKGTSKLLVGQYGLQLFVLLGPLLAKSTPLHDLTIRATLLFARL